jgi:hypothetical protein
MFFSFVLTITIFNSTDLSAIFTEIPFLVFYNIDIITHRIHFLSLFAFCVVTSGAIKAAQFFFHV